MVLGDNMILLASSAMSGAKFLRKATYPVITYAPTPSGDGMKVLNVTSGIRIIISSDVEVDFTVSRVDTNEVIYTSSHLICIIDTYQGYLYK